MPFDTILFNSIFILLLIVLSAMFSGSETALTAASRGKLKVQAEKGSKGAKKALDLTSNRKRLVSGILLGNNLVNILATSVATNMFVIIFGDNGILITTVVMTAFLLIFAEILPKSYAIARPEIASHKASIILAPFIAIFSPIVNVIQFLISRILGFFGIAEHQPDSLADVQDEIIGRIGLAIPSGLFDKEDQKRILGALDLPNRTIEEVMLHRSEIEMLNSDDNYETILSKCLHTPFSRLPVFQGETENIIKIAHVKDLYRKHWDITGKKTPIKADINPWYQELKDPYFVLETTPLGVQMRDFLEKRTHFALVVDEYGALQGLVTLEDIIEEIVGEIDDEHDEKREPEVQEINSGEYLVEGSVTVRDINRQLATDFSQDQAVTIAGLLINELKYIPEIGEIYWLEGFRFEVTGRERNRITQLKITKQSEEQ
ncbi:MAG: CNNM domain-containing protein [Rhodobacteraceae bacterium]|nr:CNNM domain-containing protein [Paracoccaceae bacterium]